MEIERGMRGREESIPAAASWVAGSWKMCGFSGWMMWEKESFERGLSLSFYKYSEVDI
jgi:hypothetical protein